MTVPKPRRTHAQAGQRLAVVFLFLQRTRHMALGAARGQMQKKRQPAHPGIPPAIRFAAARAGFPQHQCRSATEGRRRRLGVCSPGGADQLARSGYKRPPLARACEPHFSLGDRVAASRSTAAALGGFCVLRWIPDRTGTLRYCRGWCAAPSGGIWGHACIKRYSYSGVESRVVKLASQHAGLPRGPFSQHLNRNRSRASGTSIITQNTQHHVRIPIC